MVCRPRHVLFALAGMAMLGSNAATAQDAWPAKPLRLVVGFAAGGPTDVPARYVADKLGALLGQRVIVENKTGAGGMIATREVLAQPRDGYNLLLCTHFESINKAVYRNAQYELTDLAPISLISKYYYGLAIANTIPGKDLKEFVQHAKTRPGDISYGTVGTGSAQEIFARQLERLAGISMTKVPYRGGAQIAPDLIAGRVQFYVSPMVSVIPLAADGKLKIIGVSSTERLKAAPQVPTIKEQGFDFVRFGWLGVCAGAGTPQNIVDLLNRHLKTIVASAEYQAMTEKAGSIPESSTPAELRAVIERTRAEVEPTIKEFGLQQD